jgi:thioredoxin 1
MTADVVLLDRKSFRAALKGNVVLVGFWEPWCGPCQIQLPVLEEVARRVAGRAIVAKVNVDSAQSLAAEIGIQSLPTVVLFKSGKVVQQFVGSHSAAALTAAVDHAFVTEAESARRTSRRKPGRRIQP